MVPEANIATLLTFLKIGGNPAVVLSLTTAHIGLTQRLRSRRPATLIVVGEID